MKTYEAQWRFCVFYAVLFGGIGAVMPFAALWMTQIGMQPAMVGATLAAPSIVMLFTTMWIGSWADKLHDRRQAIIGACWVVLLIQMYLLFTSNIWIVATLWLVAGVVNHAKLPITDAAAFGVTRTHGGEFARLRVFGSIGFLVALVLAGGVYDSLGIGLFVSVLLLTNGLRLLAAYRLPLMPSRSMAANTHLAEARMHSAGTGGYLYQPAILFTLIGGALINASHASLYAYSILLWTGAGMPESLASMAFGIGILVEIALMWWFKSLTRNLSSRMCLMIAAVCGVLRWSLLAVEPPLAVTLLAQMLHGVTFGLTFLACASFISRRVPEHSAASGQSLLASATTGLMAAATIACGQLFDNWQSDLYWLMSGLCVLALMLIGISYRFSFSE